MTAVILPFLMRPLRQLLIVIRGSLFFRASQRSCMRGPNDRANHSRHVLWLSHVLVQQTGPACSVRRHSLRAAHLCDGRSRVISPDIIADFRALPFAEASFPIVVFDQPHLERVGENAWMVKKYGRLDKDIWRDDLRAGFEEAFRVLRPHGVIIFKWNKTQITAQRLG